MKVQELRNLLKDVGRDKLEKAFAESYKQFTKRQKEEVDLLICDIFEGKETPKTGKQEVVNFDVLEQEITIFLENAYAQNYLAPNRTIPKSQRPKWRFLVKNYIKELMKVSENDENHTRMVKLFSDLYRVLCEACNTYLFSTDDPFRSIGWDQPDLFGVLVKKTFEEGYSEEHISSLLVMATAGGLSRESLHIQQEMALLSELKTSDTKYIAIEEAKKLIEERKQQLKPLKKYDSRGYYLREYINNLCDMVLLLSVELAETETGVKYFFNNAEEYDREIILYRALDLVEWSGDDDLWIQVYRYGLTKKIKPRDSLVKKYERLMQS